MEIDVVLKSSRKKSAKSNRGDRRFRVMSLTEKSVEIVGLRGEIRLWCDRPFNEYPDAFLKAFEFLANPLREYLNWYQNDTMDRVSPVTSRTFSSPKTWVTRGKQDVARSLYLKGAREKTAVGQYVVDFEYLPDEALYSDSNTPFIRQGTPSELLESDPNAFLGTAKQLCDLLPFLSGHVGYCLEISPYFEVEGQRAAYPLAMHHPGLNIASDHATWPLRHEKGAETVNWLTLLGEIPLNKLGGIDELRLKLADAPDVEFIEAKYGLILKAGGKPQLGNTNRGDDLPLYKTVYRAIKPVLDPVIRDFRPFNLGTTDDADYTERWLRRFES
jgi:hypothetical protein